MNISLEMCDQAVWGMSETQYWQNITEILRECVIVYCTWLLSVMHVRQGLSLFHVLYLSQVLVLVLDEAWHVNPGDNMKQLEHTSNSPKVSQKEPHTLGGGDIHLDVVAVCFNVKTCVNKLMCKNWEWDVGVAIVLQFLVGHCLF